MSSLRTSARSLLRAPGFALTATLTLGLGIGLSTAVFTVADATLLRTLPVRDQDRLVTLWGANRDGTVGDWPLTLEQTRELTAQSRALSEVGYVASEGAWPVLIRTGDHLTRLRRALVSGNYFDVLGTVPVMGRTLRQLDDVIGADPVVVISHGTWQSHYGGAADRLLGAIRAVAVAERERHHRVHRAHARRETRAVGDARERAGRADSVLRPAGIVTVDS